MFGGSNTDWQVICRLALTKFESVCDNVSSGKVSYEDILLLQRKLSQFMELCSSLSSHASQHVLNSTEMRRHIQVRKDEYDYFINFEKKLLNFIKHLKNIPIKGKYFCDAIRNCIVHVYLLY